MRTLSQEQKDVLESLIDGSSLAAVVAALSEIAAEKAEHIRSTWQESPTAKPWDSAARRLSHLSTHI